MNRWMWLGPLLLLFCFVSGTAAYAFGAVNQDTYVLTRGETHKGDLAVNAKKAVIEGVVDGDLYVFAENVQVIGEVKGDVISFAGETDIRGKVDGNVRSFTQHLTIEGEVTRNVTAMTQNLVVAEEGTVRGSVLTFAESVDLFGKVGKEANGAVNTFRVTGQIGQGVSMLHGNHIQIDSTAVISGDLNYMSPQKADIQPGAAISGKITFTPEAPPKEHAGRSVPFLLIAMSLLSTLILWLLIRYLFPAAMQRVQQKLDTQLGAHLGVGALLLLATPVLIVILLFTVVGIPIAVTLGLSLALMLYIAKIFIGAWAGTRLIQRLRWRFHPLMAEGIGVLGLYLLLQIPFLGWLIGIGVWMAYLGSVAAVVRQVNTPGV